MKLHCIENVSVHNCHVEFRAVVFISWVNVRRNIRNNRNRVCDMHTTVHESFIYIRCWPCVVHMHVKKNVRMVRLMAKLLLDICNRVQNVTNYPRRCSLKSQLFGILFHATWARFQYQRMYWTFPACITCIFCFVLWALCSFTSSSSSYSFSCSHFSFRSLKSLHANTHTIGADVMSMHICLCVCWWESLNDFIAAKTGFVYGKCFANRVAFVMQLTKYLDAFICIMPNARRYLNEPTDEIEYKWIDSTFCRIR